MSRTLPSRIILLPLLVLTGTAGAGVGVDPQPKPGEPLPGLTADQLERFFKGRDAFVKVFTPEEGLGPIFNQNSCGACHNVPVGGAGSITVTRFGYFDENKGTFDPLEHLGGSLLQHSAIHDDCEEFVPRDANRSPNRVTNSALGMGLVEAIPDAELEANELSSTLGGQIHWVIPLEDDSKKPTPRAGRFGWKAQVATTLTFSGDAALMEMGITNRLVTEEQAPNGDMALLQWCLDLHPGQPQPNDVPDKEGVEFIDRVTDFQRFLAPPPQTPKSGMTGETHFMNIGCGECHRPSYITPDDINLEDAIRNRELRPYSDFLLHSMGLLGDEIEQGGAGPYQFRTPSLWGVAFRDPLLHDGRVAGGSFEDRMIEVIQWHGVFGSAAKPSADAFGLLGETAQDELIAFLKSLGRREFDGNDDGLVTYLDFLLFAGCYTGPGAGGFYDADDPCAVFDVNQDGAVDETDFAVFHLVYDDLDEECDLWFELADLVAPIEVTIPSRCLPACPADLNNSGAVDVQDLLVLLAAWGPCGKGECPADLNNSGAVDVQDLLILLAAWGPCEP